MSSITSIKRWHTLIIIRESRLSRLIVRQYVMVSKLLRAIKVLVLCVGIYAILAYAFVTYINNNNCCDDYYINLNGLSQEFWCPCDTER